MDITCTIDDREIREALERLQAKTGNMKQVMNEIGLYYRESVQKNFDSERTPDGRPWQRLSATTLMMRLGQKKRFKKSGALAKKGKEYLQGKKILTESGDLRESVRHQATRDSVTIGSDLKYAAIHQFGGPAGRGRKVIIPARPYLASNRGSGKESSMELAEKDKIRIMTILKQYLEQT